MSKPVLLKLSLVIALSIAASAAYGAALFEGTTSVGGTSFTASNKVKVYGASDAGDNYSIRSGHIGGDKVIASRSGDAKLYFSATAVGAATTAASAAASGDATGTTYDSWTSM